MIPRNLSALQGILWECHDPSCATGTIQYIKLQTLLSTHCDLYSLPAAPFSTVFFNLLCSLFCIALFIDGSILLSELDITSVFTHTSDRLLPIINTLLLQCLQHVCLFYPLKSFYEGEMPARYLRHGTQPERRAVRTLCHSPYLLFDLCTSQLFLSDVKGAIIIFLMSRPSEICPN